MADIPNSVSHGRNHQVPFWQNADMNILISILAILFVQGRGPKVLIHTMENGNVARAWRNAYIE